MRKALISVSLFLLLSSLTGCSGNSKQTNEFESIKNDDRSIGIEENEPAQTIVDNESVMNKEDYRIKISVAGRGLFVTLYNNSTSRAILEQLPMTVEMKDLYSREMAYFFPDELPTDKVETTGYEVGEIIYWPPRNTLVIMYAQNGERFAMQKVGRIETGVEVFEGTGDTEVSFELVEGEAELK